MNSPTPLSRAEVAADRLLADARTALTEYGDPQRHAGNSRLTAVYHLATGAARSATARTGVAQHGGDVSDADMLEIAHLIIAELAVRIVESERKP